MVNFISYFLRPSASPLYRLVGTDWVYRVPEGITPDVNSSGAESCERNLMQINNLKTLKTSEIPNVNTAVIKLIISFLWPITKRLRKITLTYPHFW
ncbi:MAG: hypothetical protein LUG51_11510 [Tannerellaceae bacterium]|nr:hypothetical protein [Tannerellaceae bacterium]